MSQAVARPSKGRKLTGSYGVPQVLEGDANGAERSDLRREVESELLAANKKIAVLDAELVELRSNPGALEMPSLSRRLSVS